MIYVDIENLVHLSKSGDVAAKEKLISEFTPLIVNLCKKSYVNSYDFSDIKHECYKCLLKCVQQYSPSKQAFVGYATAAIKNCVNNLIRISIRRDSSEGPSAYVLDGKLDNILCSDMDAVDDILFMEFFSDKLKSAIKKLKPIEQELVTYLYFKSYSINDYAKFKDIPYSTVIKRRNRVLEKLKVLMNIHQNYEYIN